MRTRLEPAKQSSLPESDNQAKEPKQNKTELDDTRREERRRRITKEKKMEECMRRRCGRGRTTDGMFERQRIATTKGRFSFWGEP